MTIKHGHSRQSLNILIWVVAQIYCSSMSYATENSVPHWWGNSLGKDQIVLPGFEPIKVEGDTVYLGVGRSYRWANSFLPTLIESRGKELVASSRLELGYQGQLLQFSEKNINVVECTPHHAIIEVSAKIKGLLEVTTITKIEYDGLAQVTVEILPLASGVEVDKLTYNASIVSDEWTKMLAFKLDSAHKRQKKVVFTPEYNGELLSVFALTNGERSFWWFVDNADGWLMDYDNATTVSGGKDHVRLQQNIIDRKIELNDKITFSFNLLVTPVKEGNGNIRSNRFARRLDKTESVHHGVNIWWTTAFAHQIYPYTKIFENMLDEFPEIDRDIYVGAEETKENIRRVKELGIDWIPYFSAHMLNRYDPAYMQFRQQWKIEPEKTWDRFNYDAPYSLRRDDSYLTPRADGYTDYLIYRFSELVDELGFEGLYFDQGGVMASSNKSNGLWHDTSGKAHGSTDILALREFHKRLATMLHLKGKKGLVYSHNSNTAIVPAYSFVTAMVQGEEYNHWLKNYDYIDSVSLDEVRSRLGSSAFGVPTMWLEVIKAADSRLDLSQRPYRMSKEEWLSSDYYIEAYNKFMALALLHDMSTWAYAPIEIKDNILKYIDWVDPEVAKFIGYWNFPKSQFKEKLYYSYYSIEQKKLLLVFANLGEFNARVKFSKAEQYLLEADKETCKHWQPDSDLMGGVQEQVQLKSKSFFLLPLTCQSNEG